MIEKVVKILQPLRIITIISLLTLTPIFKVEANSALIIFYGFFPIYVGSLVAECASSKNFKEKFKELLSKYIIGLPTEFIGVTIFALMSIGTVSDEAYFEGVKFSFILLGIGGVLELYHLYVRPRFQTIVLTPAQGAVAIVGIVVLLFFVSLQSYFVALEQLGI